MRHGLFAAALGVVTLIGFVSPGAAAAETRTVTSAADSGPGSLRALIAASASGDVIVLPDPTTLATAAPRYELTSGELLVQDRGAIEIRGAGADRVTIDANENGRVLNIRMASVATTLTMSGVTVTGGKVTTGTTGVGGGIFVSGGAGLVLEDSAVVDNVVDVPGVASFGGGIGALGEVTIRRSLIARNTVHSNAPATGFGGAGGAMWVATSRIESSTVTDNSVVGGPGTAAVKGGGVVAAGGSATTTIVQSTVVRNAATSAGGSAGGNVVGLFGATVTLGQSIVAHGTAVSPGTANCSDTVTAFNSNVYDVAGVCPYNPLAGDVQGDPKLDTELRDHGGPTDTVRLQPGSPAIDLLDPVACVALNVDQRKAPRPGGAKCDAGAFEVAPPSGQLQPATGVGTTVATLNASLSANAASGTFKFVYGTAAGQLTSSTPDQPLGPTAAPIPVSAALSGLEPNRTYFFALEATTPDGTSTLSPPLQFTTVKSPPAVVTGDASSVTLTSAVLGGTIDARGTATEYRFEIGPNASSLAPLPTRQAGDGRSAAAVTETVAGLTPGTTYSYRLVAGNEGGTTMGEVKTFTTTPVLIATPTPTGSATPVPTPTRTPPQPLTLTKLSLSPSRPKARFKKATIRLTLAGGTGVATVRFTVEKRGRRGKYAALKGSFSQRFTKNGALSLRWNGRVGGKRLAAGSYRLVAVATPSTGARTKAVRKAFTVRR